MANYKYPMLSMEHIEREERVIMYTLYDTITMYLCHKPYIFILLHSEIYTFAGKKKKSMY